MELPSQTPRILVVDDDAARAARLVAALDGGAPNWLVETALSGRGALAALNARRFDMLVTTCTWPAWAAARDSLMSRLASVLEPFGLGGRAAQWLDWTMAAARSAA